MASTSNEKDINSSGDSRKRTALQKDDVEKKKLKSSNTVKLAYYVGERQGERDEMQDYHTCLTDCTNEFPQLSSKFSRVAYFAVFDGHAGMRASKFCGHNLHRNIYKLMPRAESENFDKEIKTSIIESFKQTDNDFLKIASNNSPAWKDGTTACCLLVLDDFMYICNLGDSKAVLCRHKNGKNQGFALSKEHNPTNYDERKRIEKCGGHVRDGRVLGILEVSRSIGDGQYKRIGVCNTPDVKRCKLTCNDKFVIVACDGLWKVYTNQQAVDFICQFVKNEDNKPPAEYTGEVSEWKYLQASNKLASEAVRRGSGDNVTCIIVTFN